MSTTKWHYRFEKGDSIDELTGTIEESGEGGWELVNVVKDKGKVFIAILKRPAVQPDKSDSTKSKER
jgi:hypothetical protein